MRRASSACETYRHCAPVALRRALTCGLTVRSDTIENVKSKIQDKEGMSHHCLAPAALCQCSLDMLDQPSCPYTLRHPPGPAAPHLRRQAAGGWAHACRLQHPEGSALAGVGVLLAAAQQALCRVVLIPCAAVL